MRDVSSEQEGVARVGGSEQNLLLGCIRPNGTNLQEKSMQHLRISARCDYQFNQSEGHFDTPPERRAIEYSKENFPSTPC
jgi:hypothetical protein